jgi:hypothetical protein
MLTWIWVLQYNTIAFGTRHCNLVSTVKIKACQTLITLSHFVIYCPDMRKTLFYNCVLIDRIQTKKNCVSFFSPLCVTACFTRDISSYWHYDAMFAWNLLSSAKITFAQTENEQKNWAWIYSFPLYSWSTLGLVITWSWNKSEITGVRQW